MKNLPANGGDAGLIPALGNPLERATHCTILAGESHGQRSMAGCSPVGSLWGHRELVTTE